MTGKREDMSLDNSANEKERRYGTIGDLWRKGKVREGDRSWWEGD